MSWNFIMFHDGLIELWNERIWTGKKCVNWFFSNRTVRYSYRLLPIIFWTNRNLNSLCNCLLRILISNQFFEIRCSNVLKGWESTNFLQFCSMKDPKYLKNPRCIVLWSWTLFLFVWKDRNRFASTLDWKLLNNLMKLWIQWKFWCLTSVS